MTDSPSGNELAPFDDDNEPATEIDATETVESIAEDVRDEIRLGHIEDDVSHVLEVRFDKAGIDLRPEDVDDLAEEIERDVST